MTRIRFTIAGLLILVLYVAVGFAALRESNDLWDSGVLTVTLGALLISILLAVHRAESGRAFWIGFALFGWTYVVLSLLPSIESRLLTSKALAYLESQVPERPPGPFTVPGSGTGSRAPTNQFQSLTFNADGSQLVTSMQGKVMLWDAATGRVIGVPRGTNEHFIRIGHSLFALLAGWFGGQFSRRLWRTSRAPEPSAAVNLEGITP
jgi:hypothetical protein